MYIMDESATKGKRLVAITIILFMGFAIFDFVIYALNISRVGIQGLISQVIEVMLGAFLSYYLYKGSRWARGIIGVVLIFNSISYLFRTVEAVIAKVPIGPFVIYIILAFIVNFALGILLMSSKDIKNFLEFQKIKSSR